MSDQDERTPEEIEAAVEKAKAEAAKARADAALAGAQAKEAEARVARIEMDEEERRWSHEEREREHARKLAYEDHKARLDFERHQADAERHIREERIRKASDYEARVYRFVGVVDASSVRPCVDALTTWDRLDSTCPMEVTITSPGGSIVAGFYLFDTIRSLSVSHQMTTTALGVAASMAGVLLQAGDRRRMGRETILHMHDPSSFVAGSLGELEDSVELLKLWKRRVLDIFTTRSNMTRAEVSRAMTRRDTHFDSARAVELRLVDEVVG